MADEYVTLRREAIIEVLRDLETIVVSLARIGSAAADLGPEEYYKVSSDFLDDWSVCPRLARARRALSEPFSEEVDVEGRHELEREMEDVEYWSVNHKKPSREFLLRWIEPSGGLLVAVPEAALGNWHGIDSGPGGELSDYERACEVDEQLGIVAVGEHQVLVLNDDPNNTTWIPNARGGGYLIRWVHADNEKAVIESLTEQKIASADFEDSGLAFTTPGPCRLFDAAESGTALDAGGLVLPLRPGTYTLRSAIFDPSPRTRLIVHELNAS